MSDDVRTLDESTHDTVPAGAPEVAKATDGMAVRANMFFERPRLVALAMLVIIAAGLSAFLSIGRQEDPAITNLFANITTVYPGADPERVEALVTEPLERGLREISEIGDVNSTSATGISIVSVELRDTIDKDLIESVWSEIRDVLSDVTTSFPAGVLPPEFDNDITGAFASISVLVPGNPDTPPAIMSRYAQRLSDVMRAVPGTRMVEVIGQPDEEILITVDSVALTALGLTVDALAQRVAAADAKVRAGRVRANNSDFLIEVQGEFTSLDRLGNVPVISAPDGSVTRLADIARLEKAETAPQSATVLSNGIGAVMVGARVTDGIQVDAWTSRLERRIAEFEQELPASLTHERIFDQSRYTAERLSDVAQNMLIGVTLVILVLLLTLGFRAAAIVALVLPLVGLATIATLNFMGMSIQQMSVTGLIVALGLLVDAAIVMTDDIAQQISRGKPRGQAAALATRKLGAPLLASTVTTALAFMPMVVLPGAPGDFVGSIAISVIVMLFWSLIIAMTLTPALAAWFLPRRTNSSSWLSTGIQAEALGRLFASSLRWAMYHPLNAVLYALVLPIAGFLTMATLIPQFFPGVDRDQFHIEVTMPPGTAINRTKALVADMDESIRGTNGIERVSWVIGRNAPAFYYNMQTVRDNAPGFAHALVTTDSPTDTARLVPMLQQRLGKDFPQAEILVRDLVQGPPVSAPVELRLISTDLAQLREAGDALRRIVAEVPEVTLARTSLDGGAPKLSFKVDEDSARLAGLSLTDIARQLEAGLEGVRAGSLIEATEELPVRIRVGNARRSDLGFIRNFNLQAPGQGSAADGMPRTTPLSAIAQPSLIPAQSGIRRLNGERINMVQGFIQYGVLPEAALTTVVKAIEDSGYQLPSGVRLELGGDADARADTINNLIAPLGFIVTLSIGTVVMVFNSFRLAGITLMVAGLSAGLSIFALAVFQYPFGITAVIGVIGSIGVSINAAIIILSALQADEGARAGDRESMVAVVSRSSRHIVSTTITTFGGFLPLILDGGGFWPPFAMSVAGGVLLSTVVSFYFTPPMFAMLYARRAQGEKAVVRQKSDETDARAESDTVSDADTRRMRGGAQPAMATGQAD
ncbi:MAG: efflux RND transporter permease subunit [Burkholderiaceae bacterium]